MTRRLAVVITAVVLFTLVLSGFGTVAVGNLRARHTTLVEVRRQATAIAANLDQVVDTALDNGTPAALRRVLRQLNLFRTALDVDGIAVLTADGQGGLLGTDQLPKQIDPAIFSVTRLRAGNVVSGTSGKLVYAAAPEVLSNGRLVVVVLSRQAASALTAAWRTFFLAALATLALGIAAAIILGRRLTKPIREASQATMSIARGELSTRLREPPAHDHDELAELARSVNVMAVELERARVLEQQFLLSVSHDLRTPLTSIRGYAEAISDGAADPQRAASVIRNEARRLERLVADLLDLAKLRAKGFSLQPERLDLVALANVAGEGFEPDAADRNVSIHRVGGGQLTVIADHDRLAQVAANLLENALKYARSTVTITAARDGAWAVLAVDDDGPGIPDADLPHVFDRLYVARSQPTRHESSSGLGLAIVKELVEAMGGTVMATRSPTGGARLALRLPIVA
ncbi:MAG: integral rane sensor signal transduction histidine kinase [Ilumatobacteraceae bacterium]|nr:integral rane sensor signal transduction histidine kinase [Ilumatobacteraceae bacterium]